MPLPTREKANELLHEMLTDPYLLLHSRATEVILRRLAVELNEDEDLWGITGLLHDLDLGIVGTDEHRHAKETVKILRERFEYPEEGLQAILAHNGDVLGIPCVSKLDHALTAGESITGMVFAMAAILPSKRIEDVKPKSVAKRIKEPRFAAGISRERLGHYEAIGYDRPGFCRIAVEAMRSIADELQR